MLYLDVMELTSINTTYAIMLPSKFAVKFILSTIRMILTIVDTLNYSLNIHNRPDTFLLMVNKVYSRF